MININKKKWCAFTEAEMSDYQQRVYDHYRVKGFPYYETDHPWRFREFMKLRNYSSNLIDSNGHIKQTMHGLSLAWSYMPHSFDVQCGNMITPLEAFNREDLLRLAIKKRVRHGDNMSDAGMRKTLRMLTGVQGVSNFRPTAAKALYDRFAPGGTVLDMSCGYGGRLLGFQVSKAKAYIGCEPATKTFNGLLEIKSDFVTKSTTLLKCGSEDLNLQPESVDFAFTSPPYFDWEKYSDESTQSYIRFPNLQSWVDGFLGQTLHNVYHSLKPGKFCAINIANTKSAPSIEEDCVSVAKKVGFKVDSIMGLKLSTMSKGYKIEPIFIFKK